MNPEQWLSLKWNGGSTMSDRWLNQSKIIHYVDLILKCIENLSPEIVIHRLTGDGPRDLLIAPEWSVYKRKVLNRIAHEMKVKDVWQGDKL